MTQPREPDVRIGDAEREQAVSALGEHLSSGRLTVDEYGERSAKVTTAKTRGELAEVFDDLPAPRPTFGGTAAAQEPAAAQAPVPSRGQQLARFAPAVIPIAAIAAVVVFMTTHAGFVFVLIPIVAMLAGGSRRGCGGRGHHDFRHDMAERHRDRMEYHRERIERRIDRMGRRYR